MIPAHVLLATTAALIWGGTFPISAIALESTPPIFFGFLRFLCAAAFVVVVPRPAVPWPLLIAIGVVLGGGQYAFVLVSMTNGLSAGLASLLVHTQAFFTILIAIFVFGERLNRRHVLAILLAGAGLAALVVDRAEVGAAAGLVLILMGALCGAVGNNFLKKLGNVDMVGVSVWMSLPACVPLLVLSLWLEGAPAGLIGTFGWDTAGALAYLAVLSTVVVFAIWGKLFTTYAAAIVAPFLLLVPVFGMSLSALVLGERLSALQFGGAALVFAGLAVALWPARALEPGR